MAALRPRRGAVPSSWHGDGDTTTEHPREKPWHLHVPSRARARARKCALGVLMGGVDQPVAEHRQLDVTLDLAAR